MTHISEPQVWFIGAGPGDPELLTLKGQRLIAAADLVLYAGSLVPPEVVAGAKAGALVRDSSPLTLQETHALLVECVGAGGLAVRVHTGDPSLYGAVQEQAVLLEQDNIRYGIVPGVTAAFAAAAAGKVSFTMPEQVQSLIITRRAGRTSVPERESLVHLAQHGCSLAIYLSAGDIDGLAADLRAAGLPLHTPILLGHRVSWPDGKVVWATLETVVQVAAQEAFTRQTVFLVLPAEAVPAPVASKLYAADFRHGFRE